MNGKNFSGRVITENLMRTFRLTLRYDDLCLIYLFVNILIQPHVFENFDDDLNNIWLVFSFLTEFLIDKISRTNNKRQKLIHPSVFRIVSMKQVHFPHLMLLLLPTSIFWYFYISTFSLMTIFVFNKVHVSSIRISTLHTCALFIIFFFCIEAKRWSENID